MTKAVLAAALLWALAANAGAVQRFGLVVANDQGREGQPRLRYAARDARRFAATLNQVGEVAIANTWLLRDEPASELESAIGKVRARVVQAHRDGDKAVLFFYFSGHATPAGIELGNDVLSFARLKALVASTGADLRITLLDSCNSSAVLHAGGKAAQAFQIDAEDRLTSTGDVYVASSAADEASLESSELKGSVFSHHLVAGLRGAADRSGDRQVSLDELFRYAYQRTTQAAPQHPGFGVRLDGFGEIGLSSLRRAAPMLQLPPADRVLVSSLETGDRIAELDAEAARSLVVPPGRYEVRLRREEQEWSGVIALEPRSHRVLAQADLQPARPTKGGSLVAGLTPLSSGNAPAVAIDRDCGLDRLASRLAGQGLRLGDGRAAVHLRCAVETSDKKARATIFLSRDGQSLAPLVVEAPDSERLADEVARRVRLAVERAP